MPNRQLVRLAATAVCALAVAPAAHADTVTAGMQTLNSDPLPAIYSGQNIPVFQGDAASDYAVAAPVTGTITSWRFLSGGIAAGKTFALRVLRPAAGGYTAVATSGPAAVTSAAGSDVAQGPFVTSLAVQAGDRIALQPVDDGYLPNESGAGGADGIRYFDGPFADGTTAPLSPGADRDNGQIVPVQAMIQPAAPAPGASGEPAPPAPVAPQNQVPPSISGTPAAGETLTCNPGSWGGSEPLTYTETWSQVTAERLARPHTKVSLVHVTTQLGSGPTVIVPDLAPDTSTIRCSVTARNDAGVATAAATPAVVHATLPALAHQLVLNGLRRQPPAITLPAATGAIASCSTGAWVHFPTRYVFAWYAGRFSKFAAKPQAGKKLVSHRSKYRLRAIDAKRWMTCRVIAYNAAGHTIAFSAQVHGHA